MKLILFKSRKSIKPTISLLRLGSGKVVGVGFCWLHGWSIIDWGAI